MKSRSWSEALRSFADPMTYFQAVRLLHYYSYSHVRPRRRLSLGEGVRRSPNVSLRNGERITVGRGSKIGERAYIWPRDASGADHDRPGLPLRPRSLRHRIGLRARPGREDRRAGAERG